MQANCWYGKRDLRVKDVPDPTILNPRDAILKTTLTAICGSDLHLYNGVIPGMQSGDILGHEFMGEVVEVGPDVQGLSVGDRVVVPFPIACGGCFACEEGHTSLCENSNPNAALAEKLWGHSPSGMFGYSHIVGGYAGGQAEYVRVPFADVDHVKIPDAISDEQALFLSDVLPTGYMAAEHSVPGVYGGFLDKFPFGSLMNRSLTLRTGQTHVHRYTSRLLDRIERGDIDPSFIITHRMALRDAPAAYQMFNDKEDGCIKVVLTP